MSLADRIKGDSLAYGGSALLVRVLTFFSIVAFARILPAQQLGAFNVLTIAGLGLVSLASVEMAQGLLRYTSGGTPADRAGYYATAFWFTLLSCGWVATALALFSSTASLMLFGDARWSTEVALYALCVIANSVFLLLQSMCRALLRRDAYVAATVSWAVASFGLAILLAYAWQRPLMGVIAGQALGAAVGVAVALRYLGIPSIRDASSRALAEMLRFSLPLVVSGLSVLAATYANRLVLTRLGTLEDVAVYTISAQVANIASFTLLGIQSALGPLILAHHEAPETRRQVANLFGKFWVVSMAVCLLLGIGAAPLIALVFSPSYSRAAAWVFPLSVATTISQIYVFWPGFSVAKKSKMQMWVTVASGIAGVIVNILAVWFWGVKGAVIGMLVGTTLFLVSWAVLSNTCYRIPISLLRTFGVTLCAAAAYIWVGHGALDSEMTLARVTKAAVAAAVFGIAGWLLMALDWRGLGARHLRGIQ